MSDSYLKGGNLSYSQISVSRGQEMTERERIIRDTRMECDVDRIKSDVVEIKGTLKDVDKKIDKLSDRMSADRKWAIGLVVGLLGVMARGFGWL